MPHPDHDPREHMHHTPPDAAGMGRRRRRVFDSSELRLLLLSLISDTPRHGYDIIKAIEELTGGAYAPSPGMVYPTLTLLVEMGHAEETGTGGAKKIFEATGEGRQALTAQADLLNSLKARLSHLAEHKNRADAPPVRRAIHNLKSAIHNRLGQDGIDDQTILAIAEILDEAAQRIERVG